MYGLRRQEHHVLTAIALVQNYMGLPSPPCISAAPPSIQLVAQKGCDKEKGKVVDRTKSLRGSMYLKHTPLKHVGFVGSGSAHRHM